MDWCRGLFVGPRVLLLPGLLALVFLVVAACSSNDLAVTPSDDEPFPTAEVLGEIVERTPSAGPTPGRPSSVPDIPPVDISMASVPLTDVVFDTFGNGELTLADATEDERYNLLDLIPPLDDPLFVGAGEDPWLTSDDRVTGYVAADGQAYAFPHRIMALHEIVNATLGDQPVLITFCPLCDTSVVFHRRPTSQSEPLTFSNTSALLYNDMVMVDRETGSYWWQVAGTAVVGALNETSLQLLSSSTQTWASWQRLYPDTLVLSRDTGYSRDYETDRFTGYADTLDEGFTPFPVPEEVLADERLSPASRVVVVEGSDGMAVAVAIAGVPTRVVSVALANETVLVLVQNGSSAVYLAQLDGQALNLVVSPAGFVSPDGSVVDLAGRVTSGPGAGGQLQPYASRTGFWFSILTLFPQVELAE